MKVLLLTHGEPLDPSRIVSGNSLRALGLALGLIESGHQVVQVYPAALGEPSGPWLERGLRARTYADRAQLAEVLAAESPDVLLVGYWELIEGLPEDLQAPIVLDVVAPRLLEAMYQDHLDLDAEVSRTLACYRRAERFLVGNQRQMSFLLPWLILAGFDCRLEAPIDVIPISAGFATYPPIRPKAGEPIRFVTGGVSWPWRRSEPWLDGLAQAIERHGPGRAELVVFAGRYVYEGPSEGAGGGEEGGSSAPGDYTDKPVIRRQGLLPYGAFQETLRTQCHIGLELAEQNPERWHSQSFRALECLSLGLPLICNGYLELAEEVAAYDAGWVIDRVDELDRLVASILADPDQIARKSANALRLVEAHLHYRRTIQPLLAFLAQPRRAARRRSDEGGLAIPGPLGWMSDAGSANQMAVGSVGGHHCAHPPEAGDPQGLGVDGRGGTRRSMAKPSRRQLLDRVDFAALVHPTFVHLRRMLTPRLKPLLLPLTRALGHLTKRDRTAWILISRADIWPPNHGAAVKIERTAWGLSFVVDRVYLLSDDRSRYHEVQQGRFRERRYPAWLQRLGPDPKRVRAWVLAQGIPASDAFLYEPAVDWGLIARTLYVALRFGARIYQAEFPAYGRAACWARDLLGGRAILVEHNIEYRRLAEQFALSTHAYELLRKIELGWCQRSDAVVVVSERDRAQLLAEGVPAGRLHLIPHGVDLESFARAEPLNLRALFGLPPQEPILVYHGIYGYPPNLEAMQYLAQEILPRLEGLGIQVQVLAIGAYPPPEVLHPRLRFIGPVAEVAPYLKGADLAVVPLKRGGGTRMKILDYFAAGLPVVSTSKGAEGIPITPGREALIADDPEGLAQAIAGLLADPKLRAQLAQAARAFVEPLDWRAIARRYLALSAGQA